MKVVILYRPNTEHERQALDYMRDFTARTGKTLPTVDPDSPEGVDLCRLYDIMSFPAILATNNDGHVQNVWTSEQLPTFSEVSYYLDDNTVRPI